ncbi:MAG: type IX secretion system sortase PorU [Bacteroidetes bacterium]|nr:type IX secretion system sortase PorU [Bacteroidota bacterium]
MKLFFTLIILIFVSVLSPFALGQEQVYKGAIKYNSLVEEKYPNGQKLTYFQAQGGDQDLQYGLPLIRIELNPEQATSQIAARLTSSTFIPCTEKESAIIRASGYNLTSVEIQTTHYTKRKAVSAFIEFIPVRINPSNGIVEKLIDYEITTEITGMRNGMNVSQRNYAEKSVLSEGHWYKYKIEESGIYQLTYSDLEQAGIAVNTIDPQKIQVYSNAGYMLPEANDIPRLDDLNEIPIQVVGEQDGSFDPEDYILFYGLSPDKVSDVLGFMLLDKNLYDNFNYYFLTIGQEDGRRISEVPSSTNSPSHFINKFNDYRFYEEDNINLLLSGKTWYAQEFGEILNQSYSFEFPEIIEGEDIVLKVGVANRTFQNEAVVISINDQVNDTLTLTSVGTSSTKYAQKKKKTYDFQGNGPNVNIDLTYLPADNSSRMWLDYIYVNAISELKMTKGQVQFREMTCVNDGAITRFTVSNTNDETDIWEVTDYMNPSRIESEFTNEETSFTVETNTLREFIAFDRSHLKSPQFVKQVENQNLHGAGPFDYIIVTHPLFNNEAERLKALHETYNGFNVLLTTPEEIYNEFSSGKQDPTAIRDMMKMYYDRYEGQEPRFLLLFGDGSFDPKDRIPHNTNFIPTFQTEESWVTATSYVVDDYFGILDDDEGQDALGYLDIGIGRFPVQTEDEAKIIVDKIERYLQPGEPNFGDWRTQICMIADDEDGNLHLEQADSLSNSNGYIPSTYNQHKIYLDAFPQQSTPSGDKYPEVTDMIDKQISQGALIVNYIGHGGTGGWAHERILQQNDILNWENTNKLPVFITATCEFSRFDEPELVSGGELVILNPKGGGIALFTTTRLAYSQSNFRLNERIYSRAFTPVNGEMPYLGDLIRESKPPGQYTTRNFVLLGDPGVRMAYPKFNINTLSINGNMTTAMYTDTIKALQKVTITGQVTDNSDHVLSSFNGYIYPVLYDKSTVYKTIGNDPTSYPVEFTNQDKILWKGKASVINGDFSFTFVVPKDISLGYGKGKISYYAASDNDDAFGSFENFILGGISEQAETDNTGPDMELYINDLNFVSGSQTNENPVFLAFLSDENGINLSSNGIGHDITLIMNDNHSDIMIMNDWFIPNLDDFQRGSIEYPFYKLPDGNYTLTLKAWDNYNNSSEKSITFIIDREAGLNLSSVMCHPNPFSESTTFSLKHTKPGTNLNVVLEIYNLFGKYILSYEIEIFSAGTEMDVLNWDGRDVNGAKVGSGIYIYTVTVRDADGQVSQQQQKFIVQ